LSPNAIEDEYQRRFALGRLAYYQQCNGEGVDGRLVARGLERLHEQGRKRDLRWLVSHRNTVVLASAHRPKLVLSGVPDEVFLFADGRLHAAWEGAAPLYFFSTT
jgi:hypothetical protein